MTDLSRVLAETHREAMGRPAAAAPSTPARDVDPDTAAHLQEAGRVPWDGPGWEDDPANHYSTTEDRYSS